jgi:hypothetical protein
MELEYSPLLANSWTQVASYAGISMSHTLTAGSDGLVALTKYRFRIRAINAYGSSPASEEVVLSLAPLPGKFDPVTKVQEQSSKTSMKIRWTDPSGEAEPILGYKLRMTDTETLGSSIVYDNPTNVNVQDFIVQGLTPGRAYSFEVLGVNFNGAGLVWSDPATFQACTAPSAVGIPTVAARSSSQLTYQWAEPGDSGSCPITRYELYIDNKATNQLELAHSGEPHVRQASITIDAAYKGQSFRYYLKAVNVIGATPSLVGYALFATVPDAPAAAPASDASVTAIDRIKVTYGAVTADGGSEVQSYSLEMDDGDGGDFKRLTGAEGTEAEDYLLLSFTQTEGIREGVNYRFRYRARNAIGWGDYSPISYVRAAAKPSKPPAPQLGAASSTGIVLKLSPSSEDGGSPITGYKVFRDDGISPGQPFTATTNTFATELTRADGLAPTFTATVAADGLVLGKIYRFVTVATNAYGDSQLSNHLVAGVGDPPQVT